MMNNPLHLRQIVRVFALRQQPVLTQSLRPLIRPQLLRSFCTKRILFKETIERPEGIGGKGKQSDFGKKSPVTWVSFATAGVIMVVVYVAYEYARAMKEAKIDKSRKKEIGKSKIGGAFDLIDHTGKPAKSEDFYGKWILLYFGFTHCPDICPDEMEKLGDAYDILTADSKKSKSVSEPVPLFITVDPERDGVKEVAEYVKEFHPKFIGLTGSAEKVQEACKAFRVYFSAGPRTEDNDYIVDHTIIIYLLDPEGQFVDYYGQSKTPEDIANSVKVQMAKYVSQNRKGLIASLVSSE